MRFVVVATAALFAVSTAGFAGEAKKVPAIKEGEYGPARVLVEEKQKMGFPMALIETFTEKGEEKSEYRMLYAQYTKDKEGKLTPRFTYENHLGKLVFAKQDRDLYYNAGTPEKPNWKEMPDGEKDPKAIKTGLTVSNVSGEVTDVTLVTWRRWGGGRGFWGGRFHPAFAGHRFWGWGGVYNGWSRPNWFFGGVSAAFCPPVYNIGVPVTFAYAPAFQPFTPGCFNQFPTHNWIFDVQAF